VNFADGYLMEPRLYMLPNAAHDTILNGENDSASCSQLGGAGLGSENIRSVLIRLAVRSGMTDQKLNVDAFNLGDRLVRRTLVPYTGLDDTHGAGFRLRTMTTEVMMPNLATRVDLVMD
jgi:hypothetical protein